MKAAVGPQVLRREAQQVEILRRRRQPAEALLESVAVFKQRSAGAPRQFRHQRRRHIHRCQAAPPAGRDVEPGIGVEPASVQRTDDHLGADRLFNDADYVVSI